MLHRDRFSSSVDLLAALLATPNGVSEWDASQRRCRYVAADCSNKETAAVVTEVCDLLKQKGFFVARHHSGMASYVHGITVVQPPLIGVWDEYPKLHVMDHLGDLTLMRNKPAPNASEIQKVMDGETANHETLVWQMAMFNKIMLHNCFFGTKSKEYDDENTRTREVRAMLLKIWSETPPACLRGSEWSRWV